jgi:hypothetical protein
MASRRFIWVNSNHCTWTDNSNGHHVNVGLKSTATAIMALLRRPHSYTQLELPRRPYYAQGPLFMSVNADYAV